MLLDGVCAGKNGAAAAAAAAAATSTNGSYLLTLIWFADTGLTASMFQCLVASCARIHFIAAAL